MTLRMSHFRALCLTLMALSCTCNQPNQGNGAGHWYSSGTSSNDNKDANENPYYSQNDQYNQPNSQQKKNQQQQQQQQQQQHNPNQQQQQQQHNPNQQQQQKYNNPNQQQQQQQQYPSSSSPPSESQGAYGRYEPPQPQAPQDAYNNYPPSKVYPPQEDARDEDDFDKYDDDSEYNTYGDEFGRGLDIAVSGESIANGIDDRNSTTVEQFKSSSDSSVNSESTSSPSSSSGSSNNGALFGSDLSQVDKDVIFEGLKKLYKKKVLPLEIASKYSHFSSPPMGPSDFEAKPMVLILGQYSVGKTSFIRSLVKQDFPGQRIGPEPTTDRFTAIMHASEGNEGGRQIPGHALVMQQNRPFRGLASFGNNFLSKFEGAEVTASILRNITIVDTPGVLAGEKQRIGRDYDFGDVIKWFAERADMIIIMFDAHKLDISDELKTVLDVLKPHQDKIRVLLNKADTIDAQALLRVYGALMWSLGKVVQTPEVCRVFLGSFWENPLRLEDNRQLLEKEKQDLLNEMMALPQNAVVRRINELVKRARSVKVHAYIIHYLKKQMPYVVGKKEKQKKLLDRLDREFLACARRYNLPLGDFPNVDQYRKMLSEIKDISDFKKLDKNMVYEMDKVLTHDIPLLLQKATNAPMKKQSPPQSQQQYQQQPQQQQQQYNPSYPDPQYQPQQNKGKGYFW